MEEDTSQTGRMSPPRDAGMAARRWALDLAQRHNYEEGHSLQDERLALLLFEKLSDLGLLADLPETDRMPGVAPLESRHLLQCAAILHDIGYEVGYQEHHKHAFRMILADAAPDLPPRAQILIAHIARYHRGSLPDPGKHRPFGDLSLEERSLVAFLAAVLRLADGLDRSHTNAVHDVDCRIEGDQLVIRLVPGQDDADERWAAQKKSRFLAGLLDLRIIIS